MGRAHKKMIKLGYLGNEIKLGKWLNLDINLKHILKGVFHPLFPRVN